MIVAPVVGVEAKRVRSRVHNLQGAEEDGHETHGILDASDVLQTHSSFIKTLHINRSVPAAKRKSPCGSLHDCGNQWRKPALVWKVIRCGALDPKGNP